MNSGNYNIDEQYHSLTTSKVVLDEIQLSNLLIELCEYWFINNKNISKTSFSKILWHDYELKIWKLGEDLRILFKKDKKLKNSILIQQNIEKIALNKKYGKGRESFVLLIGEIKAISCIQTLVELLTDPEVRGHAIISLTKLRAKGMENEINQIFLSSKGWIKNAAKKYVANSKNW